MLNRLRFALAVIRHDHTALDRSDLTGFKVKRVTAGVDNVTITLTARSIYAADKKLTPVEQVIAQAPTVALT